MVLAHLWDADIINLALCRSRALALCGPQLQRHRQLLSAFGNVVIESKLVRANRATEYSQPRTLTTFWLTACQRPHLFRYVNALRLKYLCNGPEQPYAYDHPVRPDSGVDSVEDRLSYAQQRLRAESTADHLVGELERRLRVRAPMPRYLENVRRCVESSLVTALLALCPHVRSIFVDDRAATLFGCDSIMGALDLRLIRDDYSPHCPVPL